MCSDIRRVKFKSQRGISLILVLFLIVIVSLLTAAMAQLIRGGSNAVSMEIQSTRALFAAESGAQVAAMRIFPINGGAAACTNFTQSFTVSALNGCSANITCAPVVAAGRTIYTVTSAGVCGSGNDRARRRITIGLRTL